MTNTRSRRPRHISTDPLHVVAGPDGSVVIFVPDGQSIALTIDAAARSTLLLARAVRRAHATGTNSAPGENTVIPVDFVTASGLSTSLN